MSEIDLRCEEGGARNPVLPAGRSEIGERDGGHGAAHTVAADMRRLLACDFLRDVECRQHALVHVVLEGLHCEPCVRVHP